MADASRSLKLLVVGTSALVALTGCSSFRDAFGLSKKPPDEFAIVTKAPLVIPPEFSLKPPRPGAPNTQEMQPSEQARQTVFGKEAPPEAPTATQSAGEVALVEAAGAERADPTIRRVVMAETSGAEPKDSSFAEKLLFWKKEDVASEPVVDAVAEAQRVREREAAGQPVTAGDTKVVEPKKKSLLTRLWPF